ncbi:MAG: DUF1800 domain-containing protein [Pseudanabaenaceae cyanobacterium bins.68]|nr:DUF1800 domain-containing protein [Pseudanabaenaceae cyanobacterium bins.68]
MDASVQKAHFFRRASFGATPTELYSNSNPSDYLNYWLNTQISVNVPYLGAIGDGSDRGKQVAQLYEWLIGQMVSAANPLHERMVNFWREYFTVSLRNGMPPQAITDYEIRLRGLALGDFRDLLYSVATSPAMLRYLNNDQNRVNNLNENFSRELMELFTLGEGNYTEKDVQEGARSLTGWVVRTDRDAGVLTAEFQAARSDNKSKTYLGRTGNLKTEDVVEILANHPATAKYLANRLWSYFVFPNPEAGIVNYLADVFTKYNRSIGAVISVIFSLKHFYSDRAYYSQIKDPIGFMIGSLRQLEIKANSEKVIQALRAMGQVFYDAPTVKGWKGGTGWLTAPSLLTRLNTARQLTQDYAAGNANGYTYNPQYTADQLLGLLLDQQIDPKIRANAQALSIRDATALILSAPNYQLF